MMYSGIHATNSTGGGASGRRINRYALCKDSPFNEQIVDSGALGTLGSVALSAISGP